jgi:hypothetical protein
MNGQCDECRRLWRDYAGAISAHIQLDSKLKLAALTGDDATIRVAKTADGEGGSHTQASAQGAYNCFESDGKVHGRDHHKWFHADTGLTGLIFADEDEDDEDDHSVFIRT